jgi:hypothetical protein
VKKYFQELKYLLTHPPVLNIADLDDDLCVQMSVRKDSEESYCNKGMQFSTNPNN